MKIFAYGSNLSSGRLRARVPSARFEGRARLDGYQVRFHKRSVDGSGKASIQPTGNEDCVWGAVFDCPEDEKSALDAAEGLGHGYDEYTVTVHMDDETAVEVLVYAANADSVDDSLEPYTWYLEYVISGAMEQGLPREYIEDLQNTPAVPDPDVRRDARNRPR